MQGASLKTICLCVIRHDFVDKHQKSRNILRFCLSFSSMKCVIKVIPPHSSESPFVWVKAGLGSIRLGTMWNWISILDVKIFILFNSLLLGGKVSEWKVQKLTLHIQMFNKFDNFFLLWHFYYTSILDCFIYFYFFLQSHLSNQWMAASSRFLGFRRRSQFALWLGSCSRSRGKNLLCQVRAFFHIIIR